MTTLARHPRIASCILLAAALVLFAPSGAPATSEYAGRTGKDCGFCHTDAIGGGELSPAGRDFLKNLASQGRARGLTPAQHIVRLFIGYLHITAATLWFGTILYVHLLLKPAYASKGLPRGEVRLGMASMLVVLATGVLLTIARMPNLEAFGATRFGILLTVKIGLFFVMFGSAVITVLYIGPKLRAKLKSPVAAMLSNDISPEQLARFDGQEGRPACIAYKNIVYDVTNNRLWNKGAHMVKHHAGTDLTAALANAPHGEDKVLGLPQVGMLQESAHRPRKPFSERLFYFFAYMNLVLVFVILFVIALWRWL